LGCIFLDIDWSIGLLFPNGRFVVAIDHVELHFHVGMEAGGAPIGGSDYDPVPVSLNIHAQNRG
jgi:hypothetical protein